MRTVVFLVSLILLPGMTHGYSGNQLLELCEGDPAENGLSAGLCTGYVVGVVNGLSLMANYSAHNVLEALEIPEEERDELFVRYFTLHLGFCPPKEGVEEEELQTIAIHYLKEHPEQLDLASELLIHMALMEAFPCEQGS
jgi:hypothetical protein